MHRKAGHSIIDSTSVEFGGAFLLIILAGSLKSTLIFKVACGAFFDGGGELAGASSNRAPAADKSKIEALFNKYKGTFEFCAACSLTLLVDPSDVTRIGLDGIERLLADLDLSPDNKLVLVLAWLFNASAQCEFSRQEFLQGMANLKLV